MTRTTKSLSTKDQPEQCEVADNGTMLKKSRKKTEPKKTENKQPRSRVIRKKTEDLPEDEAPMYASANNDGEDQNDVEQNVDAEHPGDVKRMIAVDRDEHDPDECSEKAEQDDQDEHDPDECSEQAEPEKELSEDSLEDDEQTDTSNRQTPLKIVRPTAHPPKDFSPRENDTRIGKVYKMDHRQAPRYASSNNHRHNKPYNNRENGSENGRENRKPRREYTNSERGETKNSCLKFSYREVIQKLENDRCGDLTIDDHLRYLIAQTHQDGKPILNTIFKQIYQAMNHEASYPLTEHQLRGMARHQKTEYGGSRNHRDGQHGGRGQTSHHSRAHEM